MSNTGYTPTCGVYTKLRRVYTAEAGIEVIVVGFCTISQVMDRFHKKAYAYERKHLLRNIWLLINPLYTFKFLQTLRHSFDDRGEFGMTTCLLSIYQDNSLFTFTFILPIIVK